MITELSPPLSPAHIHPASNLPLFKPWQCFIPLGREQRGWVVGAWGEPGMQGRDLQGTTNPLGSSSIARLLIRSHGKQLPVNKQEQKLGSVFKVMSYVENMFRGALNVPVNWREAIVPDASALEGSSEIARSARVRSAVGKNTRRERRRRRGGRPRRGKEFKNSSEIWGMG